MKVLILLAVVFCASLVSAAPQPIFGSLLSGLGSTAGGTIPGLGSTIEGLTSGLGSTVDGLPLGELGGILGR